MKKFIISLWLILSLCLIVPTITHASISAMAALQETVGLTVQLVKIPDTFDKYLGKYKNGSIWLYQVYKAKPSQGWIIKKLRIFR